MRRIKNKDEDELVDLRNEIVQLKQNLSDCYEFAGIGQWEFDLNTGKVRWSEMTCTIFELPEGKKSPGTHDEFLQYVYPEDRASLLRNWEVLKTKSTVMTSQYRIFTCTGGMKHIRCSAKSALNEDGKLIKLTGILQDITALVELELHKRLDEPGYALFQRDELPWMGGFELNLKEDALTMSESLVRLLEFESGDQPRTSRDFIDKCVVPRDRERLAHFREAVLHGQPVEAIYKLSNDVYHIEYRIMTNRSHEIKHLTTRFIAIGKDDPTAHLLGLSVDVTLSKKYETELLKSREQFKLLFDNMTQGVSFHDREGKIINHNAAAQLINGLQSSEYMGKDAAHNFNFIVLREDGTEMPAEEYPVLKTIRFGEAVNDTVLGLVNPLTNTTKWLRVSFIPMRSPLLDEDGFFALFEDISDSKKSIELLQESNNQFSESLSQLEQKNKEFEEANRKLTETKTELRSTLRQLELRTHTLDKMALVLISDLKGIIIEVNDRFLEVTGYERWEIIGTPYLLSTDNIFHAGVHTNEFLTHIKEQIIKEQPWSGEVCKKTKSGKLIWLLETIMPLKNDVGEIERLYFFCSEITQLKDREEIITQEKRVAEKASRIKEEFLSLMSHEIRTPLNSVIGLTNLLLRRNPREDQMEVIQTLKNSSDNLLHLVNNILDYNKLQADKINQEKIQFSLSEYLQHVDTSSRIIAQENGIHWKLKMDPGLPEVVKGDLGRVNQILNNLINNAIKFTPKGCIQLEIGLQARVEKTVYILFTVSDSGIGISDDKQKKVFQPFYQANSHTSENAGGTGLGLSIVKGLVDLLKGHIYLESTLGKGSVFSVELPFEIPAPDEINVTGKEQPIDLRIKLKGCKVLYVEDVESNRFVIESLLSDNQIEITTVSSGQEALLLTNQFIYDVILMDIQMPVWDGFHTVEAIRQQARGKNKITPIIAFTAKLYNDELKENLIKHNIQDIIVKPFNAEILLEKIAAARFNSPSTGEAQKKIISFSFYEIALRYNKRKLTAVKSEIIQDLIDLQRDIKLSGQHKDLKAIQQRIHRLRPIASNLDCEALRILFHEYGAHTAYTEDLNRLNQKILPLLALVIKVLEELPY